MDGNGDSGCQRARLGASVQSRVQLHPFGPVGGLALYLPSLSADVLIHRASRAVRKEDDMTIHDYTQLIHAIALLISAVAQLITALRPPS